MKHILCFAAFFLLTIAILSPRLASAQDCGGAGKKDSVTAAGTEFLVAFLQNEDKDYGQGATTQQIFLASVSDSVSTVTITSRGFPNLDTVIILPSRKSVVWDVNHNSVISSLNTGIVNSDETVDSVVFRIKSTHAIMVYGLSVKDRTADAFLTLPVNVQGPDYRIMSFVNSIVGGENNKCSEFCVAAFNDSTDLEITPAAPTKNGIPAGTKMQFRLDSGEVVQIQADLNDPASNTFDMTGSAVKVTSPGKHIAVYGGHQRTEVPSGYVYPDTKLSSRDYLQDAMPPLTSWGSAFVTRNLGRPAGDMIRALARDSGTHVKLNNTAWFTSQKAGEFHDILIASSQTALNNVATIESEPQHPLLIGMLAHTAVSTADLTGDPFLAIVPPVDQVFNDFTYFITSNSAFDQTKHFLLIAAEQSATNSKISIDGKAPLPPVAFTNIPWTVGGKNYAIALVNQQPSIHRIQSPAGSGSFSILGFGWGEQISYGYTAGALFKPLGGIMAIKNPDARVAPGSPRRQQTEITIRNITNDRVYFDSARVSYSENAGNNSVRLAKDIALDIGTIESAEEKTVGLTTSKPVEFPIRGTFRVWCHSALWHDLYPADFPFSIEPEQIAGVGANYMLPLAMLKSYPNPSFGSSSLAFSIPSRAYTTVKIYDALGRLIRTSYHGEAEGMNSVSITGLTPGSYTVELSAPEIGITEHCEIIVM